MNTLKTYFAHLPLLATLRRLLRACRWLLGGIVLAVWGIHVWGLPAIVAYKPELERRLSAEMGRPITIGQLQAGWSSSGRIRLDLNQFHLAAIAGGPALTLRHLQAELAWSSLLTWSPQFARLDLDSPSVDLARDAQGRLWLNGIDLSQGSSDGQFVSWLLQQEQIRIHRARLTWSDAQAGLVGMQWQDGEISLERGWFTHDLQLTATPPNDWVGHLRARLVWQGDHLAEWETWRGHFELDIGGAQFSAWQRYLAWMRSVPAGQGQTRLRIDFERGALSRLEANFAIQDVSVRLSPEEEPLLLPQLAGQVLFKVLPSGRWQLRAQDLVAKTASGVLLDRASVEAEWMAGRNGDGFLSVDRLDLEALGPIFRRLPLDQTPVWKHFSPSGFIETARLSWQGELPTPSRYQFSGQFRRLGWQGNAILPTVSGLSGSMKFTEADGALALKSFEKSQLILPAVFAAPLQFDELQAEVNWQRQASGVNLDVRRVAFANADVAGEVAGRYQWQPQHAGTIDFSGQLSRAKANRVHAYLPLQAGHDTRTWLAEALRSGEVVSSQFTLQGDLDRFPFEKGGGVFRVESEVRAANLKYAPDWPEITDIDGQLIFDNQRMDIIAQHARTQGVALQSVRATLPDITQHAPTLEVQGQAQGATQHFFAFLASSPLDAVLGHLAKQSQAQGNGHLNLRLRIPLAKTHQTQVKGEYDFQRNRLRLPAPIPEAQNVTGRLSFTEKGATIQNLALSTLGGAARLSAVTRADGKLDFDLKGVAESAAIQAAFLPAAMQSLLSGRSGYRAQFRIGDGLEQLTVRSDLTGITLNAPEPLFKAATEARAFELQLTPSAEHTHRLALSLGADTQLALRLDGQAHILAGALQHGRQDAMTLPQQGWRLNLAMPVFRLDDWRPLIEGVIAAGDPSDSEMPALRAQLQTARLELKNRVLSNVSAQLTPTAEGGWGVTVQSDVLAGRGHLATGLKKLTFDLSRLQLPLPKIEPRPLSFVPPPLAHDRPAVLPEIAMKVTALRYANRDLGRAEGVLVPRGQGWAIESLQLNNADGQLHLQALPDGAGVSVRLDGRNFGGFVERMSGSSALVQGKGVLSGQLRWGDGTLPLHLPSLDGTLQLTLEQGAFAHVQPGAAKLLSIFSLESVLRRLRLDFRDVFGEGMAFDRLAGTAYFHQGRARTGEAGVHVSGAIANIAMRGELDLVNEVQQMRIEIEPKLSGSLALAGAVLANPVMGMAALAAQKAFDNPFGRLLSLTYEVSGRLNDPQVRRVSESTEQDKHGRKP